jgi:hypothetical protein
VGVRCPPVEIVSNATQKLGGYPFGDQPPKGEHMWCELGACGPGTCVTKAIVGIDGKQSLESALSEYRTKAFGFRPYSGDSLQETMYCYSWCAILEWCSCLASEISINAASALDRCSELAMAPSMYDAIKATRDLVVLFTADYEKSPFTRKEFTSLEADRAQSSDERHINEAHGSDASIASEVFPTPPMPCTAARRTFPLPIRSLRTVGAAMVDGVQAHRWWVVPFLAPCRRTTHSRGMRHHVAQR